MVHLQAINDRPARIAECRCHDQIFCLVLLKLVEIKKKKLYVFLQSSVSDAGPSLILVPLETQHVPCKCNRCWGGGKGGRATFLMDEGRQRFTCNCFWIEGVWNTQTEMVHDVMPYPGRAQHTDFFVTLYMTMVKIACCLVVLVCRRG